MIFVDEARIFVKGGNGGKGCDSFVKDRGMRHLRPDGGDGGKGGSVVFIACRGVQTLLDFKYRQHFKGGNGGHGSSKGKKGKAGLSNYLRVPVGTIIKDFETGLIIRDLVEDEDEIVVARGGSKGIGNANKKISKPPGLGEERTLKLELKLMADVGLVGFPNVGKSTIISHISRVKSKIANYPFTTKKPILGVVCSDDDEKDFVVADLPGIIEGAHQGKGLGDRFLRHAERTKILVHVVDMASIDQRDPIEDFEKMNKELQAYGDLLVMKKRIIVANKIDLPQAAENVKRFKSKYGSGVIEVSAIENKGLEKIVDRIREVLCQENSQDLLDA